MESKRHKRERWARDKVAGQDAEEWAKIKQKIEHPLDKVGSHKKNDDHYDIYRNKMKYEVKINDTPLSEPQKEFQKRANTGVIHVGRNNPVHVTKNIGRKIKKILEE